MDGTVISRRLRLEAAPLSCIGRFDALPIRHSELLFASSRTLLCLTAKGKWSNLRAERNDYTASKRLSLCLLISKAEVYLGYGPADPHSFHSFSQFQIPDVTLIGNGNPS